MKIERPNFNPVPLSVPLSYVKGNHDIRYKDKPPEGGNDLHGRLIKIREINILGLEGSHWYNGGPYQYTEGQMRSIIRWLRPAIWWRGGVDVVFPTLRLDISTMAKTPAT